ncbi:MAG: twin-arginine translocase subunit TatC [Candidatus Omnitrophica bacterium]|nr:twin-arginine translocase subunit TatC [Candidatus Omnitrophota bacterium]
MATATKKIKQFDEPGPLLAHLAELRTRIIYSLCAVALCAVALYSSVDAVVRHLAKPVGTLYFIGPIEAFWSKIKLSFFLGLLVSLPFVLFQVWSFIQRGLLPREKRFVLAVTAASYVLFLAGASFCYFLILPVGVRFLLAYGSEVLVPMLTISRYLAFVTALVFAFGLIFQVPVIIGFLVHAGILKARDLRRQWRLAVVAIFIVAGALTPGPDVFSQIVMAGPLIVLYVLGIGVATLIERRREK